jgi:hypothetical protein
MRLNRLSQRERASLVSHITGGKALPTALLDQIVARTDGVPLFVEELTKAVLESDQLRETSDQYVIDQPAQPLAIPTTLQDSLMARVDRLGSAREVLQIGAAIGREFSYDVLAAVAGMPDAVLQDALVRLTEAELVFARGTPPNATYTFKHALIQDTSYSTMLRIRRQQLHTAIARVMEKRFPDVVSTIPEVVAQQFERAGQSEKAIHYYMQAGDRNLRRFAMKESIAHYSDALRLALAMPETSDRDAIELDVRLGLGLVQQISHGPTARDAATHYQRALTLSLALPNRGRERFLASWGLWFNAVMSGASGETAERADELVTIARELDNPSLLMEAYHARVPMLLKKPDFAQLGEAASEVVRIYDRERHRDHAYYFGGHDARMCARSFYAIGLWGLGLVDQAYKMSWLAVDDARQLGHALSLAHALHRTSMTMVLLKDDDACRAVADELHPLAERNKFPWQLAEALFLRGLLATREGNHEAGIEPMLHSANLPLFAPFRPFYLVQIADAELRARQFERSAATLHRVAKEIEIGYDHFCEPEMHRLRGEVLLAQSCTDAEAAEHAFREAMTLAARQSSRVFELRAGVSLAKLLGESGRRLEARDLLAPVYGGFTEGFERPDLQAAKAMLTELK